MVKSSINKNLREKHPTFSKKKSMAVKDIGSGCLLKAQKSHNKENVNIEKVSRPNKPIERTRSRRNYSRMHSRTSTATSNLRKGYYKTKKFDRKEGSEKTFRDFCKSFHGSKSRKRSRAKDRSEGTISGATSRYYNINDHPY